jgi:chromosome segregation ATPase
LSNAGLSRTGDRRVEGRASHVGAKVGMIPPAAAAAADDGQEADRLRDENSQLRALCLELEQALQEAATGGGSGGGEGGGEQARELEALLEEKSETIRHLHQHVEDLQTALAEAEAREAELASQAPVEHTPVPREDELLSLSEELERERRQLQEDEQTLMDQMREMEVGMARERAELARQRNDLQRLQADVRHELERLERNGALQSKIDSLKTKLQDVTARRGARGDAPAPNPPPAAAPPPAQQPPTPPKGNGLMGRLFGQGGR